MSFSDTLRCIWRFNRTIVLVLTPLILLPLPLMWPEKPGRCAYAICIMAVYWMTEALPIAVTALLPVVLMPWLNILGSKDVCVNYLKDTNFLFFGGLLVAVAVEKWNLHKRIALRVLLLVGSRPIFLMFGFMSVTAFLSMWLSNTATTAMMVPIAHAVLMEIKQTTTPEYDDDEDAGGGAGHRRLSEKESVLMTNRPNGEASDELEKPDAMVEFDEAHVDSTVSTSVLASPEGRRRSRHQSTASRTTNRDTIIEEEDPVHNRFCIGLKLSIAYAANIGGTATLTGTGPNLVFKGQMDTIYGLKTGLNFSSWFAFAFPNMLLCLAFAWVWLTVLYLGPRELLCCLKKAPEVVQKEGRAAHVIRTEYNKLGPMSFAEIAVAVHFIILALLWFGREPEIFPGWGSLPFLEPGYVTDACVGVTIAVALFMFPCRRPNFGCFRKTLDLELATPAGGLLDWETVHHKMAWSVIIVLGGSFALADACQQSGLSEVIGGVFTSWVAIPPWGLTLCLSMVTAIFTEVTSNTATATIFLPILAKLAEAIGVNPLYFMIPVTISASFAFMLPVATPPNAIVFAFGHIKISNMASAGFMMNIVCILILQFSINTFGYALFDLGSYPEWAGQVGADVGQNFTTALPSILNVTLGN